MNTHLEDARECLIDNNRRGMSSTLEPIHWNLHNAISALVKAQEEESARLKQIISRLEARIQTIEKSRLR